MKIFGLVILPLVALGACSSPSADQNGALLSREKVRETILSNKAAVRSCYDQAAKVNPKTAGRIEFEWEVDPRGKVENSIIKKSTVGNKLLEDCVHGVIKEMQFPAHGDGKLARVVYPFEFQAKEPK